MRKVALLAVFALVASDVATADVVRHGSIAEAYRGTWMAGAGTEPEKFIIVLSAQTYASREAPDFELGGLSNADCGLKVRGEGAMPEPTPQEDRS
jgi:hypothetical protein